MIAEGDAAPDFTAPDQDGNPVSLSDVSGRVVLYFYPKDDTPGCTKEACSLRDSIEALEEDAGVTVIGVSADTVDSHAAFRDKYELPFTLLADPDKEIIEQYGVKGRLGTAKRVTFLIDEGVVEHVFRDVDPASHAEQILAEL